jgi:putative glycosyltransferase (TIGR04372 family)
MISLICEYLNKNRFFNYYLVTPWVYAIGTCSEHINIASRIAQSKNKKIIIIKLSIFKNLLKYKICNDDLFDNLDFGFEKSMKYKILKFFFTVLINLEFLFIRSFVLICDKFFKIRFPEYIRFPQIGLKQIIYNKKELFEKEYNSIIKYPALVNIKLSKEVTNSKFVFLKENFANINKKIKKKYVCLHVRDDGYRNDKGRRVYRNSNINNYIESIDYLIKSEYSVIRLGGSNSLKLDYNNENYIELDIENYQNYFDVMLIENCSFFIGTQSGPVDTSFLLNKPTLLTNAYTAYMGFPRNFHDRVIFKKVEHNNKILNLKEFINLPFQYHDYLKNNMNLIFHENNSKEILNSVIEFKKCFERNNFQKTPKQKEINEIIKINMERFFLNSSADNGLKNHYLTLNFIKWIKSQNGAAINNSIDSVNI